MWPTSSDSYKRLSILFLKILLLFSVLIVGLSLRFDDLKVWQTRQNLWYLDPDRPLFTSYDAFFFARLARDYQEGLYAPRERDPYRGVPDNYLTDNITYPFPVPLMSFSAARLSDWLGMPLEKVALYYTPITAVLFVIPLFLYLETLGYTAAGLLGGLCGVTAFIYVIRTSIARFDTDSLNLFFPFAIAWALAMYFRSRRPLLWVGLASIFSFLFYWWYAHPHLIFVLMLIFGGVIFWEKRAFEKRDRIALAILLLPNLWYLWKAPLSLFKQIWGYVVAITSPGQTGIFRDYPNVLQSISELQQSKGLSQVAILTLQNKTLFILGLLGAFILLVRERKALAFLWPYFLIGLLVFRSGNRFAMYLAPFIGMGLGFVLHLGMDGLERLFKIEVSRSLKKLLVLLATLLLGLGVFSAQKNSRAYVAVPKVNAFVARNMEKLQEVIPQEAWIWSWWDYGYAFQYLSRRAVFIDGGSQGSPKTYYVALSFTSPSPEEARNITAFVAREGLVGIKKRLKEDLTARELTEAVKKGRLYRAPEHPVYWVFTQDLPPKYGWIGYFGTWDFETHRGRFGFIWDLNPCRREKARQVLSCRRGVRVDFKHRKVYLGPKTFLLSEIVFRSSEGIQSQKFSEKGLILEVISTSYGETFFLLDRRSFESNFNQMYLLRRYDPRYFELVLDDFPFLVAYRVKFE